MRRVLLVAFLVAVFSSEVPGQNQPASVVRTAGQVAREDASCADQPKSFEELSALFNRGRRPTAVELTGSWVKVGQPTRNPGGLKSYVALDCAGLKQDPVFEWVMAANQYSVEMHITGVSPQGGTFKPSNDGRSLEIPVSFDADSVPVYRCRLTDRRTLACFYEAHGGAEILEFTKMPVREDQKYVRVEPK